MKRSSIKLSPFGCVRDWQQLRLRLRHIERQSPVFDPALTFAVATGDRELAFSIGFRPHDVLGIACRDRGRRTCIPLAASLAASGVAPSFAQTAGEPPVANQFERETFALEFVSVTDIEALRQDGGGRIGWHRNRPNEFS